jgi:hypothetical protein
MTKNTVLLNKTDGRQSGWLARFFSWSIEAGEIPHIISVRLADTEEKRLYYGERDLQAPAGTELTLNELAMLEESEKYPLEYDEDSPKLISEQLAQFKLVHFDTMEKQAQAMRQEASSLAVG